MPDYADISLGIRKVKLKVLYINEGLYRKDEDDKIKYTFEKSININKENNILSFMLGVLYHYSDTDRSQKLLECQVQSAFYIDKLSDFVIVNPLEKEETITLTDQAWIIIVSLSLTHLRALMSDSVSGTVLNHFIIPIVNPEVFAKKLMNLTMTLPHEQENKI